MGTDESLVSDPFAGNLKKKYEAQQNREISEQMVGAKVLTDASKKNQSNKLTADKAQNKISTRLRYFTSQISTLPGPSSVKVGTQMTSELKNERRDTMVFGDKNF